MTSRNAKEALAISPAYVKSLESDVQSLKAILDARPASLDREVAVLAFRYRCVTSLRFAFQIFKF